MDDEYPIEQDLVQVINRAGLIENIMNQIVIDYCAPRKEAWPFMWQIILDTSVMPLGAKLKVVMAVANKMNFTMPKNALNKVIQLRNSFAHNTTTAHPVFVVGATPEQNSQYLQFETLDSNGVLKTSKRHEAFEQFNKYYGESKKALVELQALVKAEVTRHDPQ